MSITVRPAEASDAPRIVQIYVESWNTGFGELMPHMVADEDRLNRWTADLTNGRTRWWVAEYDGFIAGFVGIGPAAILSIPSSANSTRLQWTQRTGAKASGLPSCERHLTRLSTPDSRKPFSGRSPDTTEDKPYTTRQAGPATAEAVTTGTRCRSGTVSGRSNDRACAVTPVAGQRRSSAETRQRHSDRGMTVRNDRHSPSANQAVRSSGWPALTGEDGVRNEGSRVT
jgi:hypothetical protein